MQRNIKIRYKSSVLGFFWTLLSPVLLIAIYAVFLRMLRVDTSLPVLVTGIIVWQFLAMCMGDSLHVILGNASLVKKTSFPRIILPLSMVAANLVNFLLSLVVLIVYLVLVRAHGSHFLLLPVALVTHAALCFGVALLFSAANAFFRDTEHILSILMLAWFFLTPVVYPLETALSVIRERLPAFAAYLFFANPMTGIVSAYRTVFLGSQNGTAPLIAMSFGVAWAVMLIGVAVFQKVQRRFGDVL